MKFEKRISELLHFKRRFQERVGEECSKEIVASLLLQIRQQKLLHLTSQSLRVRHYLLHYKEKAYIVVYDKNRKALVTILNFPHR